MFKLILCLTVALKLASAQYEGTNGILWDAQPQSYQPQSYQPQYNQPQFKIDDGPREAAEEPIVGSPLLPIIPPVIPPIIPSPILPLPGLRFGNLHAGRVGNLLFGSSLLGASNPMADEQSEIGENQISSPYQYQSGAEQYPQQYTQEYQADPQISSNQGGIIHGHGHGGYWWKKKWANDEQAESMIGASPSCGQSYQNYQVSMPQTYEGYQVSSPQNYQTYQPQPTYAPYQPQLPQIVHEYQQNPAQGYRAITPQQYESHYQPQPSAPIVQPEGLYEESEKSSDNSKDGERTWDWKWDKDGKKSLIKDKIHDKKDKLKDKFNKGGHTHVYPETYYPQQHIYYHQPQTYYHYQKPSYPVYTKPAPSQYSNYYNAYRSRNMEPEQPLESEVKSEVGKDQELKITTTELPSNKTTTTASCYSTNEVTTKSITTTTTDNSKNDTAVSTTTEKSDKKRKEQKSKKSSRRRRSVQSGSTNSKRCITSANLTPLAPLTPLVFGFPLLGAQNPNAAEDESTQDLASNPSENCERYETVKKSIIPPKVLSDNVPQETILQAIPSINTPVGGTKFKSLFNKLSLPLKSDKLIHGNILGSTSESMEPISEASESVQVDENNVAIPFPGDEKEEFSLTQDAAQYLPPPDTESSQSNDPNVGAPYIGPNSFASTKLYTEEQKSGAVRYNLENARNSISPLYRQNQQTHMPKQDCNNEKFQNLVHRLQSSYGQFQSQMNEIFEQLKAEELWRRKEEDSYSAPTAYSDVDINILCQDVNALRNSPELVATCHEINAAQEMERPPPNTQHVPQNSGNELYKNDFLSYQDYIKMLSNVNANPKTLVSNYGSDYHRVAAPNPISVPPTNDKTSDTVKLLKDYVKDYVPVTEPQVGSEAPEIEEIEEIKTVEELKPKHSIRDRLLTLLDEFMQNRKN